MTVYVQAPLPSRRSGTKDWAELGVTQQDDLLRAAILDTEKMYELADQLGLKDGPTDFLFTSLHQLEPPPEDDQRRLAMEGFALRRTTGTNLGLRLERALRRRDGGVPDGPEPPLTGAAEPSSPSDPNSRTFDEVRVGLERGELRMFVDHSRALQAVVEGFPISRAGLIARSCPVAWCS